MLEFLETWATYLQSGWNRVGFESRSRLKWRRQGYQEPEESKDRLFDDRPHPADWYHREQRLLERYALENFRQHSSRTRYLETLTYLDYLDRMMPHLAFPVPEKDLQWLDVGAKNWAYVHSLVCIARQLAPKVHIHGIELDGYRVYRDGYSRADYAEHYITSLPEATYEVGDVLDHQRSYHVVSCFLPFVFQRPLLQWGLPGGMFQPEAFLSHLFALLKPGGTLILVNQGELEAKEQGRLLTQLKARLPALEIIDLGLLPESFYPYTFRRYGWLCHKPKQCLREYSNRLREEESRV